MLKYIFVYSDNSKETVEIRNRQQIGTIKPNMFEDAFQAVSHGKDFSLDPNHVPEKEIKSMRLEGCRGNVILSAITVADLVRCKSGF